jgi:hypothetical protein
MEMKSSISPYIVVPNISFIPRRSPHWQPFQLNLPVTPVTDIKVAHDDLVVATQGRSFYILDDLAPLHQITPAMVDRPYLFKPRKAVRSPTGGGF